MTTQRVRSWMLWILLLSLLIPVSGCGSDDSADDDDDTTTDGDNTDDDDDDDDDDDTDLDGDEDGDQDGDEDGDADGDSIPESTIFEVRTQPNPVTDETYLQERTAHYRTTDVLANTHITALANLPTEASDTELYVGTQNGLFHFNAAGDVFNAIALEGDPVGITAIARQRMQGRVLIALADQVIALSETDAENTVIPRPDGQVWEILSVATNGTLIAVGTTAGAFLVDDTFSLISGTEAFSVRDVLFLPDDSLRLATDHGVYSVTSATLGTALTVESGDLADNDVMALALCPDGSFLAATHDGMVTVNGDTVTPWTIGKGGLAYDDFRDLDCTEHGLIIGHGIGGSYVDADPQQFHYYTSQRWIETSSSYNDFEVTAVAALPDGTRFYGTKFGLSRIYLQEMTLADKMEWFENYTQYFWRMDGFCSSDGNMDSAFDEPSESSSMHLGDKDNDGLWTQMMIGAWCYAYKATGDQSYYDKARRAMNNMEMQIDIPRIDFEAAGLNPGFVTRSLVREDEGSVFDSKSTQDNWHLITYEGTQYYWKDDTSSDETTGHFFGYPIFFDLCAQTDEERQDLADHAGLLASYIMDNNYYLIDLDGLPTTHGDWSPEGIGMGALGEDVCCQDLQGTPEYVDCYVLCMESLHGGGWLNSIQILGHLLAAWHMTGDDKYYNGYESLLIDHHYENLAMANEETWTITRWSIMNHSDYELAYLAYSTLIRYEPNPDRRAKWIESMTFLTDHVLPIRNPLWNSTHALYGGQDADLESAVQSMREIPMDMRTWRMDNLHRKDYDSVAADRHDNPQGDTVFPYDELRTIWWNGNLYGLQQGGDGREWSHPLLYLLPYYTLLYSGALQ